jgi:hypothetical protein
MFYRVPLPKPPFPKNVRLPTWEVALPACGASSRPLERLNAMNNHLLRLYTTPPELPDEVLPEATVKVQLGDLLPLVALASRGNYAWLQDFMDDEVVITADLHEILQAFRARRPGA